MQLSENYATRQKRTMDALSGNLATFENFYLSVFDLTSKKASVVLNLLTLYFSKISAIVSMLINQFGCL